MTTQISCEPWRKEVEKEVGICVKIVDKTDALKITKDDRLRFKSRTQTKKEDVADLKKRIAHQHKLRKARGESTSVSETCLCHVSETEVVKLVQFISTAEPDECLIAAAYGEKFKFDQDTERWFFTRHEQCVDVR